jgi:hypothetical protein
MFLSVCEILREEKRVRRVFSRRRLVMERLIDCLRFLVGVESANGIPLYLASSPFHNVVKMVSSYIIAEPLFFDQIQGRPPLLLQP